MYRQKRTKGNFKKIPFSEFRFSGGEFQCYRESAENGTTEIQVLRFLRCTALDFDYPYRIDYLFYHSMLPLLLCSKSHREHVPQFRRILKSRPDSGNCQGGFAHPQPSALDCLVLDTSKLPLPIPLSSPPQLRTPRPVAMDLIIPSYAFFRPAGDSLIRQALVIAEMETFRIFC